MCFHPLRDMSKGTASDQKTTIENEKKEILVELLKKGIHQPSVESRIGRQSSGQWEEGKRRQGQGRERETKRETDRKTETDRKPIYNIHVYHVPFGQETLSFLVNATMRLPSKYISMRFQCIFTFVPKSCYNKFLVETMANHSYF